MWRKDCLKTQDNICKSSVPVPLSHVCWNVCMCILEGTSLDHIWTNNLSISKSSLNIEPSKSHMYSPLHPSWSSFSFYRPFPYISNRWWHITLPNHNIANTPLPFSKNHRYTHTHKYSLEYISSLPLCDRSLFRKVLPLSQRASMGIKKHWRQCHNGTHQIYLSYDLLIF